MTMADDLVAQQNGSILAWWQRTTVRAGRTADAVRAEKAAKRKLKAHQPEGGVYGADCLGRHSSPTPWPCDIVRGLDDPGFRSR
ncbi:hypothetical protein [Nocardia sp. 348MFTsu5.1]|uniref:hypothetical protein n=1 Tax=Nocardia sp. 348MFTsu5.1 TaxID=1172185 RepID=UPI0003712626|nr:hypothetical protein [Nocardia sp. 348MFTsu5.1]